MNWIFNGSSIIKIYSDYIRFILIIVTGKICRLIYIFKKKRKFFSCECKLIFILLRIAGKYGKKVDSEFYCLMKDLLSKPENEHEKNIEYNNIYLQISYTVAMSLHKIPLSLEYIHYYSQQIHFFTSPLLGSV